MLRSGCVRIGGKVGMQFQIGGGCGLGWSLVVLCVTDRLAFLERDRGIVCGWHNRPHRGSR